MSTARLMVTEPQEMCLCVVLVAGSGALVGGPPKKRCVVGACVLLAAAAKWSYCCGGCFAWDLGATGACHSLERGNGHVAPLTIFPSLCGVTLCVYQHCRLLLGKHVQLYRHQPFFGSCFAAPHITCCTCLPCPQQRPCVPARRVWPTFQHSPGTGLGHVALGLGD